MARVLVIDDDHDIAELVGLRMKLDGHDVEIAHDGQSGLRRALEAKPDVMIVDWTLPGLTGPEICERLRTTEAADQTWIIMLTARPLSEDEQNTIAADELLTKPFSPRALSQHVSAALNREH